MSNAQATLIAHAPENAAEMEEQTPAFRDIRESHNFEEAKHNGLIQIHPFRDSKDLDPNHLLVNPANDSPKPPNSAVNEKRHSTLPIDSTLEHDGIKTIPQIELLGAEFANKTN